MLFKLTSILLIAMAISTPVLANQPAAEGALGKAAKIEETAKQIDNPVGNQKSLGENKSSKAETQKQTSAKASSQTEVKLEEKPVPLFPASNDKKETVSAAEDKAKTSAKEMSATKNEVKNNEVKENVKAIEEAKVSQKAEALPKEENTAQVSTDEATDLKLVEFVLANEIVSREPKEIVEAFSEGSERGFAFARLNSKTSSEVTFVWTRNGHECARITSPIHAAKQWRTFSSVKLRQGEWKVQLLDQNKVVLAEKTFTIQ